MCEYHNQRGRRASLSHRTLSKLARTPSRPKSCAPGPNSSCETLWEGERYRFRVCLQVESHLARCFSRMYG